MLLQIQGKQMAAPLSALPFSCDSDCGHDVVALYGSKKRLLLLTCEKCKTTETVLSRADDGEVCSVASAKMSVSVNLSVHASPSVALCVCVCVFWWVCECLYNWPQMCDMRSTSKNSKSELPAEKRAADSRRCRRHMSERLSVIMTNQQQQRRRRRRQQRRPNVAKTKRERKTSTAECNGAVRRQWTLVPIVLSEC
mgnify:CR=1 FL=1